MGDYEIYFENKMIKIRKSERRTIGFMIAKDESSIIEIMLHERGTIIIKGSNLDGLFKSLDNEEITTRIGVGEKGVKEIDLFIPDNDFQLLLNSKQTV